MIGASATTPISNISPTNYLINNNGNNPISTEQSNAPNESVCVSESLPQPLQTNTLISSFSLSSSLSTSSSSTSSSASSSSSSSSSTNANAQHLHATTPAAPSLTAPLATISEFSNYNSLKFDSKSVNSDLTQADTLTNQSRKSSIISLGNTATRQAANGTQKAQTLNVDEKYAPKQVTSSNSTKGIRNFFGKLIRTSLVNINETNFNLNSFNDRETSQQNAATDSTHEHAMIAKQVTESLSNKQAVLNNVANFKRGGNRATANARLQNTNNFSFSNSSLSVLKKNTVSNANKGDSRKNVNIPFSFLNLDAHMDSSFLTSPAYSNLANFCNWPSEKVYDWLNKNGFEGYFPASPDGTFIHKWIQNGLHLLQATQHEYEKVNISLIII